MSREANRLKEIITILKEHNLLRDKSPVNVRNTIEELGPTFVKMGQILSARGDLIPKEYCMELKKLRCEVKSMSKEEVQDILEQEYHNQVDEVFSHIEESPIGSASIAQTHLGRLKDGSLVAIKIQRRDIYKQMTLDVKLLKKAISILQLDKIFSRIVDLKSIIQEMYRTAIEEMDFVIESSHVEEFRRNNIDIAYLKILKVYEEFSTKHVLVMEYINGPFIYEVEKLKHLGYDMEEIAEKLADNYMKQAIDDGFYHADPHGNNIVIQDGKIAYLDFGMMGHLSVKNKSLLNKCLVSIIKNDASEIAHVLTMLDTSNHHVDYMKLTGDIKKILAKNKMTGIADIDIKEFSLDMFELIHSNQIRLPFDISMLVRGIVVLEGVLEEICPSISLIQVLQNRLKIQDILTKENTQKFLLQGFKNAKDLVSIPSETLTILKGINNGELRFNVELTDSKNQVNVFFDIFHQAIITVLDVAFIIGISFMVMNHVSDTAYPFIFYLYLVLSVIFTGWLFFKMFYEKVRRSK